VNVARVSAAKPGTALSACCMTPDCASLHPGYVAEAILVDHPRLTHDDIRAAQAFAADYLADEDIVYG
jgi:hypothetical protein